MFWLFSGAAIGNGLPQPNILLVVTDDLGIGDSQAWYAQSDKTTPTLNHLAKQGIAFERFYTDSTCSTSRAALLTGVHPARLGFHPVAMGISPEIVTLPEYVKAQGYDTALIGKWHAGEYFPQAQPWAQGFNWFYGYLNQWLLQGPDSNGELRIQAPTYYNPWLHASAEAAPAMPQQGYLPELLTVHAEQWLANPMRKQQPWFLMYATPLPHGPLVAPPEFDGAADDKDAIYHAMVSRLDRDVGRLIAKLEATGQRENTLIIVMGDNGAPEHRKGSNAKFAGGKWVYREAAVRAPLLWVWPKNFAQQLKIDASKPVLVTDIYPTIVEVLSLSKESDKTQTFEFDGYSFFSKAERSPMYWMSRYGFSYLKDSLRFSGYWLFGVWIERIVEEIEADYSTLRLVGERDKTFNQVTEQFIPWLDEITKVQLKATSLNEWQGQDFLRTPLKEWDFYIAVQPVVSADQQPQFLAGQAGSWQLTWNGRELDLQMHGGRWQVRLPPSNNCQLIGINADLYDRFSRMTGELSHSRLMLSINGIERLDGKWLIEDLRSTPTTTPLQIAQAREAFKGVANWQGAYSEPEIYHRASRVSDFVFRLDEDAIKKRLCAGLHK